MIDSDAKKKNEEHNLEMWNEMREEDSRSRYMKFPHFHSFYQFQFLFAFIRISYFS